MKNESLELISFKLKCPKEEIAKKICTLRVQFSRENVKVKRAREAGTVYNPKWFGYQLLCFLNDQSRYSSSSSSLSLQPANNNPLSSGHQTTVTAAATVAPSEAATSSAATTALNVSITQ